MRKELDYSSTGGFLNNEVDEALKIIYLSVNNSFEDATDRRLARRRVAKIDIDAYDVLMEKYTQTMKELDTFKKGIIRVDAIDEKSEPQQEEDANYVQQGNKWQGGQGRYKKNYNPNNHNHPNFSYVNPKNALQPPPEFHVEN